MNQHKKTTKANQKYTQQFQQVFPIHIGKCELIRAQAATPSDSSTGIAGKTGWDCVPVTEKGIQQPAPADSASLRRNLEICLLLCSVSWYPINTPMQFVNVLYYFRQEVFFPQILWKFSVWFLECTFNVIYPYKKF